MPIYEYMCEKCGYQFEQLQKISELPLNVCPKCQQACLRKLVSETSFRLKGGGWYETDFKNKKAKPPPKKDESPCAKCKNRDKKGGCKSADEN